MTKLDARKLLADFPIFRFHGKPLAYLDSAVAMMRAQAKSFTTLTGAGN